MLSLGQLRPPYQWFRIHLFSVTSLEALATVAHHWLTYAFVVFLGMLWGSFGNVCIYRWPPTDEFPKGRSVVTPPSHCFVCKANVKWYDNFPLLSYLWLRGKCRNCKTEFSPRYLIVEALGGVLFGLAWWAAMNHPEFTTFNERLIGFVVYAGFSFFILIVTFIDLDHMLILDLITYPSVVIFYGLSLVLGHVWWHGLVGAAFGYGIIVAIRTLYYAMRKQEGMGLGDAKLLAVIGALWGWQGVMVALFGGSIIGSVIGIAAIIGGKLRGGAPNDQEATADAGDAEAADSDEPVPDGMNFAIGSVALPFGPFLAAAAMAYTLLHPYFSIQLRH